MSLLSEAGWPGCAGFAGWAFLSFALAAEAAGHIKVLTDLGLLFQPRIYRHSGPLGPVAIGIRMARDSHPGHPVHSGHPDSDTETQQEYGVKVWKTLMSIAPPRQ